MRLGEEALSKIESPGRMFLNLETLVDRLKELGDRELQETLWMAKIPGKMSTFDEAWCGAFDDSGLAIAMESYALEREYSQEICLKCHELHRLLHHIQRQLPRNVSDLKVIQHPEMDAVRAIANDLAQLFEERSELIALHDMARIVSLTIIGGWIEGEESRAQVMLDLISSQGGRIDYDGCISGSFFSEGDMDVLAYPIEASDPFNDAREAFSDDRLHTIDCRFFIDGEWRYYSFQPLRDRLDITVLAERKTLSDGTIDFNWHYEHWISRVAPLMRISGVEFSDFQ